MPRLNAVLAERFWSRVQQSDNCWLWLGSYNKITGYGTLSVDHYPRLVHRLSWELSNGPIPKGKHVLHHCDVKLCVRPSHLFLGTQQDNVADRHAKGRTARGPDKRPHPRGAAYWAHRTRDTIARGERVGGSKLTEADVLAIRRLRAEGWTLDRLAKTYGVRLSNIHMIVTGKTWKHLLP